VLVQASRERPTVLVADLDLDQRRDWLDLFPFLRTRRPDAYGALVSAPAAGRGAVARPSPG
jgi:N-carbamoylputrescine amidase